MISDIKRQLIKIRNEISEDTSIFNNEELKRRRNEIPEVWKSLSSISKQIPKLLNQNCSDVDDITEQYENCMLLFNDYSAQIKAKVTSREIEKETLFNESKLNIKIGKYKGYESSFDIYSFQDDFYKVYGRTTPTRLMADLLKNNHLDEPAISVVRSVKDIDEIWKRLKQAYGDPKMMMNKKLKELNNLDAPWKLRDSERISEVINKIINVMKELIDICERHRIKAHLYNGDAINRIYKLIGDKRVTRWLYTKYDKAFDEETTWVKLIEFLEKEVIIQQQKSLVWKKSMEKDQGNRPHNRSHLASDTNENSTQHYYENSSSLSTDDAPTCSFCGKSENHSITSGPKGTKVIQYFSCKKFVDMHPNQRFIELRKKKLCFQCLLPGASILDSKHRDGRCQRDFVCNHESHKDFQMKKHVLVCEEHKNDNENLLQSYKERCIFSQRGELQDFSKKIQLSFYSSYHGRQSVNNRLKRKEQLCSNVDDTDKDVHCAKNASIKSEENNSKGIFQFQVIKVNNEMYTIFFDSECGDFITRKSAINRLGDKATMECDGPTIIGGVGDITTKSPHGIYTVSLPLQNGMSATMTGVCLEKITTTFPMYPLKSIETEIRTFLNDQRNHIKLPKLPSIVGGDVDFMVGIKYLRYHPKAIFQMPSGLTVYSSVFENAEGGCGVIGGPHEIFSTIEENWRRDSKLSMTSFFSNQLSLFKNGYDLNPDVSLIGYKESSFDIDDDEITSDASSFVSKQVKTFNIMETTGSEITYRCPNCRSCQKCRSHEGVEAISIREEIEQDIINQSVHLDTSTRSTMARLPFIHDPVVKLAPNKDKAMRVFNQQLKKLSKNVNDKNAVIKSEGKLQSLGHVDYISNLTADQQQILQENQIQNFIPWRAVWKVNSISTPCRIVFDASQPTNSGYSLNDLLPKGRNNMNKLQEILIRWSTHKTAFHTDIRKMYNSVKLHEQDWCYQRYLWEDDLNLNSQPVEKVIKTLIYGVRTSGNQAERGLRQTADISKSKYPEVCQMVHKDIYVDDCLSGSNDIDIAKQRADELEVVLNKGGFALKGVTFSGDHPVESLSQDGISISVAGLKWHPKEDFLTLDIDEINFAKKLRGRKPVHNSTKVIPQKLTRRQCASKVAEVYDLTGRITPIIASMKLDLHQLVKQKLN